MNIASKQIYHRIVGVFLLVASLNCGNRQLVIGYSSQSETANNEIEKEIMRYNLRVTQANLSCGLPSVL